jgi:hypothetical protein
VLKGAVYCNYTPPTSRPTRERFAAMLLVIVPAQINQQWATKPITMIVNWSRNSAESSSHSPSLVRPSGLPIRSALEGVQVAAGAMNSCRLPGQITICGEDLAACWVVEGKHSPLTSRPTDRSRTTAADTASLRGDYLNLVSAPDIVFKP